MVTYTGQHLPRRGTAAAWSSANPVLGEGERAWETDTNRSKTGDGSTAYNSLPYDLGHGRENTAADIPFTPGGTVAATTVQAAIDEVAAEAGSGGAVSSVNGETGAVTLTASDVGADVAGSSAATQSNLDDHEAALGLAAHIPTGGSDGQVLTKGAGTDVAWEDPTGGDPETLDGGAPDDPDEEVIDGGSP